MALSAPIRVGAHVSGTASVAFTSARSVCICIQMNSGPGTRTQPTLEAYMTFVGVDDQCKPVPVPAFVPHTPEEQARFLQGKLRHELRRTIN
jgi:acyl-CoA hydrolase